VEGEFVASLGEARAHAFTAERALPPPLGLRVQPGRTSREALRERIVATHPNAEVALSPHSPYALCVRRAGSPRSLPGYAEGHFAVQEEGSQCVALALGVEAGDRVADVCSGHGGKATWFAQQVGAAGHVVALDIDERKLEHIAPDLKRLGIDSARVSTRAVDLRVGAGGLQREFDRVLVDAPCTGLGTLHRRPELLLRLRPEDPARLSELQLAILVRAAQLVKPGGLLAYAVCSPTMVEGSGVAARFEAQVPTASRVALSGADQRAGRPRPPVRAGCLPSGGFSHRIGGQGPAFGPPRRRFLELDTPRSST
jgi:16S rRNA (cytosine967-C5)-methyltransferase